MPTCWTSRDRGGVPSPSPAVGPRCAELADTVSPQGLAGRLPVPRRRRWPRRWPARPRLVVLCDQVRDPGNLGTVIRCADAFGADARAGQPAARSTRTTRRPSGPAPGSLFHLPLVLGVDLAEAVDRRPAPPGLAVLGADGSAPRRRSTTWPGPAHWPDPILWVLGNEAWGLPAEHRALARPAGRAADLRRGPRASTWPPPRPCCLYATATAQRRDVEPSASQTCGAGACRPSFLDCAPVASERRRGELHVRARTPSYDPVQVTPLDADARRGDGRRGAGGLRRGDLGRPS